MEVIQQPVQPQPFKHLDEVVSAIRDLTVSFKAKCIGQNKNHNTSFFLELIFLGKSWLNCEGES